VSSNLDIELDAVCTVCNFGQSMLECTLCGLDVKNDCQDLYDESLDELDVFCHACGNAYTIDLVNLFDGSYDDDEEQELYTYGDNNGSSGKKDKKDPHQLYIKIPHYSCRHYDTPLEFPDGTVVHASSAIDRPWDERGPDLALYLDSTWRPSGLAYFIDWPDYQLPKRYVDSALTIIDVFNRAKNQGLWVEVGCIGGHGRTGTTLACMAVLAGLSHKQAVKFVRKNYCDKAIEGSDQEWYVEWFQTFIKGGKVTAPMEWDTDKKKLVPGEKFVYTDPFDWKSYDPFAAPSSPVWDPENKKTVWHEELTPEEYHKRYKKWPEADEIIQAMKDRDERATEVVDEELGTVTTTLALNGKEYECTPIDEFEDLRESCQIQDPVTGEWEEF
jgi:protein-tyrosine phosphatase